MDRQLLIENFKELLDVHVLIDPLLVNTFVSPGPNLLRDEARRIAMEFCERFLDIPSFSASLGELPFSPNVLYWTLEDAVLSTAVQISLERFGAVQLDLDVLNAAKQRVIRLLNALPLEQVYLLYWVVVGHDLLEPFTHRRQMTESEYFTGMRHYPYISETLDMFLFIGTARGTCRLKRVGDERRIQITQSGIERFRFYHDVLLSSGYIQMRSELSHLYQFDSIKHWDELFYGAWPKLKELNQGYLDWMCLKPTDAVLEMGCRTGTLTFDAGLYQQVDRGHVIAVDTSEQMLREAERKRSLHSHPGHIEFVLTSLVKLPFDDAVFDTVLGVGFLAYVNPRSALAEMIRVVRPGGWISVQQGLDFALNGSFFLEWMEPILKFAAKSGISMKSPPLPTEEELRQLFSNLGLEEITVERTELEWVFDDPDTTVQLLVRGTGLVREVLNRFSWDDRKALIRELIDRGVDVCRKYSRSDRRASIPIAFLKGRRPL